MLQKFRKARLTIGRKKCEFRIDHCSYLRHVGLTRYYGKFIPDYAEIVEQLTDLTKKTERNRVKLTEESKRSFTTLKDMLCAEPILQSPVFSNGFTLLTNPSDRGIGTVLSQTNLNGVVNLVAFYSRKLLTWVFDGGKGISSKQSRRS